MIGYNLNLITARPIVTHIYRKQPYLFLPRNDYFQSCLVMGKVSTAVRTQDLSLPFPDKHEVGKASAIVGPIKASPEFFIFTSSSFCIMFEGRFFLVHDFWQITSV